MTQARVLRVEQAALPSALMLQPSMSAPMASEKQKTFRNKPLHFIGRCLVGAGVILLQPVFLVLAIVMMLDVER